MKRLALPLAAVLLSGCASSGTPRAGASPDASGAAPARTESRFTQAAATPLSDLNLMREEIPPQLIAARKEPYALPAERSCEALGAEVESLDAALGADLDTPAPEGDPGLVERGSTVVGDAAVGAVRGAAAGLIPFRSWVRKLSGAERYAKEVAAAVAAGSIRRGFLKGLGESAGCPAPAAPLRRQVMPMP